MCDAARMGMFQRKLAVGAAFAALIIGSSVIGMWAVALLAATARTAYLIQAGGSAPQGPF